MTTIVLQGPELTVASAEQIAEQLQGQLLPQENFTIIESPLTVSSIAVNALRQRYNIDVNAIPDSFKVMQAGLLVSDMDSTLISIECIDEIADCAELKPQVAEITESAMRGEIDFETSLRRRVSLLKGLDVQALEEVYTQRLQLNPGAEVMVKTLQRNGIKVALVSGGFTFFTERLKKRLGLDYTLANVLGEQQGKLTGEVEGDICGAQAKADFLLARCSELNLQPTDTIALGDGANDLAMMNVAGLSVAYHAKPKVQQQADTIINHTGLEGVLGLLQLSY